MSTKIVWVFGPSAAGKETFIRYVKDNQSQALLARLGWLGRQIVVCRESLDWVVQADDDGNELRRQNLGKIIEAYVRDNKGAIIIIKGQDLDLDYDTPNKTKKLLINDEHEIIFLSVDFDILYQRYKAKEWWQTTMTKEVCRDWAKEQIEALTEHKNLGFKITALDSGGNQYLETAFPPLL